MRTLMRSMLVGLGIFVGLATQLAQGRDGILNAVPADAIAFAVVHNLTEASHNIQDVAKLVQAPAPDLLNLAKGMVGIQKGLDEQGDLAIVLATIDPAPKGVILVPIANEAEFFDALKVKVPASGTVEVQLAGRPALVGRKGTFAVFAISTDQEALEQFLASTTNLAADTSLATWLDANKASIVVTAKGVKQLLPKLTNGIRTVQAQMRQGPAANAAAMADALNIYVDVLTAAGPEVEQFGLGLRIDSSQTVDLVKRVQFTPDGAWGKWAANFKASSGDLLAGLPAGPFVAATGGVIPPGAMKHLMKFSVQMMQNQPQFKFTPEQAQKYVELTQGMMNAVHEMRVVLRVPEAGAGLYYGKTVVVMTVDDSQRYMQGYEKSFAALREFLEETKNPAIPVATTKRTKLGETEVLEVSTDLSALSKLTPPGGQDPQKMMKLMTGSSDKLNVYVAPADKHTVVMAYTSIERLKEALEFYKSKQPGLSGDAGVATVAALLPPGSQIVSYANLQGSAELIRQFASATPGGRPAAIPEFSASPPLGMAVKFSSAGAEGHLVVTAETLRAIGDAVAKARGAASAPSN